MSLPIERRGRTRSIESRDAILDAAVDIIEADGYRALSIERIARESGTGKQTIYRWWPTKADVVMEALRRKAEMYAPEPKTGSLHGDLTEFLSTSFTLAANPAIANLLTVLAAEAQADEAFAGRFRESFIENRRQVLHKILDQHPRNVRRDPQIRDSTLVDIVFGLIWYRLLIRPSVLDESVASEIISLVAGDATKSTRRGR